MKKFAALTAVAVVLAAAPASAAGVTISGYIDVGYWAAENPSSGGIVTPAGRNPLIGSNPNFTASPNMQAAAACNGLWNGNDQFALNDINIDVNAKFTDDITGYVSWNYVGGAAGVIDFAQVDFTNLLPWGHKLTVGRLGSSIGTEQRFSESNLNKFINMTLLSSVTVGTQDGLAISGSMNPVTYIVAITNNDNLGGVSIGTAPRAPTVAGAVGAVADNNNDKAISGRIGVMPIEGLELGASGSRTVHLAPRINQAGATAADAVDKKNPTRNTVAADASYIWGAFTIRGEYVYVKEQVQNTLTSGTRLSDIAFRGWYGEGWYDWTSKFGVGVRYSRVEIDQTAATSDLDKVSEYSTLGVAGSYKIADNVIIKGEYDINDESVLNRLGTAGGEIDNDVIAFSLVGTF